MTVFPPYPSSILLFALSFSFFFSFVLPSLHHHLLLLFFLGFSSGLGLVTAIVLVIAKKPPHSVITDAPRGLVVDGSVSCTERLGFECFDESWLMDQLDNRPAEDSSCMTGTAAEICRRTRGHRERKEARSFPPPLSSLNLNGQPSFFLRPVRKDGTLTLTEVRIHRPEILRAWRHDGRLILHLIPEDDFEEDDGEEEQEEEEEEMVKAIRDEEEESRLADWKFGNEGLRRCHQDKHPLKLQMPGVGIA